MQKILFKTGVDKIPAKSLPSELWGIQVKDIDGVERHLKDYTENFKLFIFVNVACKWGLTSDHYKEMVDLYSTYKSKGLQILAFPCGQFMNQEYEKEGEIKDFVQSNFKVEFPMFSKIEINGLDMHPIYKYLKSNTKEMNTEKGLKNIPWNFGKFLVDANGKVINFYSPKVTPKEMISDINKYL